MALSVTSPYGDSAYEGIVVITSYNENTPHGEEYIVEAIY
jgi:hypothetical protein